MATYGVRQPGEEGMVGAKDAPRGVVPVALAVDCGVATTA